LILLVILLIGLARPVSRLLVVDIHRVELCWHVSPLWTAGFILRSNPFLMVLLEFD
jgi:hypothetical protein